MFAIEVYTYFFIYRFNLKPCCALGAFLFIYLFLDCFIFFIIIMFSCNFSMLVMFSGLFGLLLLLLVYFFLYFYFQVNFFRVALLGWKSLKIKCVCV